MIAYILKVALLMGLFYIPFVLFFRQQTFFRYNRIYLLTSILASLIIPAIPQWLPVTEQPAMVVFEPIVVSSQYLSGITVNAIPEAAGQSINWFMILTWMCVAIAAAKLALLGRDMYGIGMMYRNSVKETYQGHSLVVGGSIPTPFSFGKWIFLPQDVRDDESRFGKVLRHEAAHVEKLHTFDSILIELVCAVFWFNPLVYIYRNSIKTVHEFEADHDLGSTDLVEYTQLLISQSQSGMRLALTNQFFQSQLKTRIMMMMKERSSNTRKWSYALALPMVVVALVLFAFKYPENPVNFNNPAETISNGFNPGEVDAMPLFPGCKGENNADACSNKKLISYLANSIKYPASARKAGVEGKVIVKFTVNAQGRIEQIDALRGIGSGCDEEAVRVIKSMNELEPWTPGQKDGKAVAVELTLPIMFALPPESEKSGAQNPDGGDVYKTVEKMPLFPGCGDAGEGDAKSCSYSKLVEYIGGNLKYPASAKEDEIEGRVIAQFIVETNGSISTVKILKGLDPACDKEVIRLLESMNDLPESWTPGYEKGKAVRTEMVLPVQFKL